MPILARCPFRQGGHRITGKQSVFSAYRWPATLSSQDPHRDLHVQPDANGIGPTARPRRWWTPTDCPPSRRRSHDPAGEPRPAARRHRLRGRASFLPGPRRARWPSGSTSCSPRNRASPSVVPETNCLHRAAGWKSLALPPKSSPPRTRKARPGGARRRHPRHRRRTRCFDMIGAGDHGPLDAEMSPKTFPVPAARGIATSQVRFRTGDAILKRRRTRRAA